VRDVWPWLTLVLQPLEGCVSPSGRSRHWLPGTTGDRVSPAGQGLEPRNAFRIKARHPAMALPGNC